MKKLNFAEMGRTLSRSEMKQIMAGSGCTSTYKCCPDAGTAGCSNCAASTNCPSGYYTVDCFLCT